MHLGQHGHAVACSEAILAPGLQPELLFSGEGNSTAAAIEGNQWKHILRSTTEDSKGTNTQRQDKKNSTAVQYVG